MGQPKNKTWNSYADLKALIMVSKQPIQQPILFSSTLLQQCTAQAISDQLQIPRTKMSLADINPARYQIAKKNKSKYKPFKIPKEKL